MQKKAQIVAFTQTRLGKGPYTINANDPRPERAPEPQKRLVEIRPKEPPQAAH